MPTADSSNYAAVAKHDDEAASHTQPEAYEADLRVSVKALRIAAAVERSKTEYKPEHAYTERKWLKPEAYSEHPPASKSQVDRQRLGESSDFSPAQEYAASSLYFSDPPDYSGALELVLLKFDSSPKAKPLGGLSRELLDIGLNASIKCGDKEKALLLANSSKTIWKGQFAGVAAIAADAYMSALHYHEAVKPLLMTLAAFGIHYPIISRLSQALQRILEDRAVIRPATNHLHVMVNRAMFHRKASFERPIFREEADPASKSDIASDQPAIDEGIARDPLDTEAVALELEMDAETKAALKACWKRMARGLEVEMEPDKSVKEL
ncbi:hypothetical protein L198_06302 [Cryptococcus wingfieldii CBS 7118]|uniref:Uncharacterized protein n=1 Tax=Cryptococcus wingfieldii CBS 7118 TaxID=1295528 RepID=A0A1E3IMG4_9TREE|nr:hypothetical protein L198_06302 [Cryptococcus wingfieldii CBS 7118]ODN89615.1 hypothetical protein L198_06302 [Cryptococcus wingfieldii CBS 7118]